MKAQTVTIVGMGRIGVSVALALKSSSAGLTVVGHDRIGDLARIALEEMGAIDRAEWNLINAVSAADILVLAIPVSELQSTLSVIGGEVQPHALVLDFAGLKGRSLSWAEKELRYGHYVGAIPVLAAVYLTDGRDDLRAARADLFRNSVFCLMPSAKADPQAVETAVNFGLILGAQPYFVDPHEYDSLVQAVETMPGLTAAAIFSAISKSKGWRDMLRFANTSFALATHPLSQGADIQYLALNDKRATLRWLDVLLEELTSLRRMVAADDSDVLGLWLAEQYEKRELWLKERARNEWLEGVKPDVEPPTLSEQVFGTWIGRGRKKGKDS